MREMQMWIWWETGPDLFVDSLLLDMFSLGIPLLRDGAGLLIFHKVSFEKHSKGHTSCTVLGQGQGGVQTAPKKASCKKRTFPLKLYSILSQRKNLFKALDLILVKDQLGHTHHLLQ